ncbi:hypothetical protein FQN52_001456 [Onygenales sp. PD_12]|nr:hypothetical protein FQN52_001456 [Onygenales sp. PD_12]
MYTPSTTLFHALVVLFSTTAFIHSVRAVWTCPSEREPFCCKKYTPIVNASANVFEGTECIPAPRNDNCTDGVPVECCKPMRPASPNEPPRFGHPYHKENETYYCDSEAIGYIFY